MKYPSERYVHFESGKIRVDVDKFLKTPEGQASLKRIDDDIRRKIRQEKKGASLLPL